MTTTTANTTDATTQSLVDSYFDLWLETDAAARAEKISAVFTEHGRHVDPNADANGHDGLAEMMAAVHAQFPGLGMRRVTGIDQHNDQLRFGWELLGADGAVLVAGIDVAQVGLDGRLTQVAGFWGELS
jgi:hypothetical protein